MQCKAQGRCGFAKTERPGHQVDALPPLFRAPGLDRHHAAEAFKHGGSGFGQQTLIKVNRHRVRNTFALQIFQSNTLAGREAFKLNGRLHQGKNLILEMHPFLVPFAPPGRRACGLRRFGLGALDPGSYFMADGTVLAIGAVAQDNGVRPHLGLDSGQNFL